MLQEVCKKFDDTKEFIRDKIEDTSNEKLSVEDVTYLFINDCDNLD